MLTENLAKLAVNPKIINKQGQSNTTNFAVIDSERPQLVIEHLYSWSWCSEFQSLDYY